MIVQILFSLTLFHHSRADFISKTGHQGEDDLLHWTNGNFDIARSSFEVGTELILLSTVFSEDGVWGPCEWTTPGEENWYVGEEVTDSSGEKVEGVKAFNLGDDTCGIKIEVAVEENAGGWFCSYTSIEGIKVSLSVDTEDELTTNLRLPETFIPLHYDIELIPELNSTKEPFPGQRTSHRFTGSVSMTVDAVVDQPVFRFHSDELTIKELHVLYVSGGESQHLNISTVEFDFQRTFVTLKLQQEFKSGSQYQIDYFDYGFYHRACSDVTVRHCWFTQFESTTARNAFPCLDEPGLKATFNVKVGRNDEYHSLSNMPLVETVPMESRDGWFVDVYDTSVEMSPYLVAVAVTDYKPLKSATDNTTVWAPKEDIDAGRGDYAVEIAPKIIKFYEEYFQVKYALPKMDLMYEGHKGSAMENWGLILFDTRALLYDPETGNEDSKFTVLSVVAHELAHQWFGNLVTTNWWSQTWLNEGFATFVSYLGTDHVDPEIHSWARLYVQETQRVMMVDEDTSLFAE